MSSDLNKVILIGRLTKDPDLRYTQGGTPVASFSVAVNYSYKSGEDKKDLASFFNCVAWSKLGELIVQYCKKGQRLGIEGRLQQRSWEDQDGKKRSTVEIVVENCQFLEFKKENKSGIDSMGEETNNFPAMTENNPFSDEDIPF